MSIAAISHRLAALEEKTKPRMLVTLDDFVLWRAEMSLAEMGSFRLKCKSSWTRPWIISKKRTAPLSFEPDESARGSKNLHFKQIGSCVQRDVDEQKKDLRD